jgi:hypothetical protein
VIYFACDTALFYDMKLIGEAGIDLAVLPIGDRFTMGIDDSLEAVRLINPKRVVPSHYSTWPPIQQDAVAWAQRVRKETSAVPVVVAPGEKMYSDIQQRICVQSVGNGVHFFARHQMVARLSALVVLNWSRNARAVELRWKFKTGDGTLPRFKIRRYSDRADKTERRSHKRST